MRKQANCYLQNNNYFYNYSYVERKEKMRRLYIVH